MEYKNELLDRWVGGAVILGYTVGPELTDEDVERIRTQPSYGHEVKPTARIAVFVLEGYDQVGIIVRVRSEDAPHFFVPWGSVHYLEGRQQDS